LTTGRARHEPDVQEPGLDKHEWESEWQGLEPLLADSPAEALPEVDDLVGRMMEARGFPLAETELQDSAEPETVREFAEARRIALLVDAGEAVDPGDVGLAVTAYRNLYSYLLELGPASLGPG
jgi:hypothetical protein